MNEFSSRDTASAAAANRLAANLERRLVAQNSASLVVSGGTTPKACLEALSETTIDWPNVHVVLSDERWVPADHDDSNEKLVRDTLLRNNASAARLLGVYREERTPGARAKELETELRGRPFPFACALLGMGEDGHFASLFPDASNLEEGLDTDSTRLWLPVETKASPYTRISLTLSALSRSDEVLLLLFGDDKRATLEQAVASEDALPVSRLLRQKRAPVSIYWAP